MIQQIRNNSLVKLLKKKKLTNIVQLWKRNNRIFKLRFIKIEISLLFITELVNPFGKQNIEKNFTFYLYWTVSIILFPIGIIRILIFLILAGITAIINSFKFISQQAKLKMTVINCKIVCFCCGFIIKNNIPKSINIQNSNFICNHQSAVDPIILLTAGIGNFLAKEEIQQFPLFKDICKGIGCIFVPSADKKEQRHQFASQLEKQMRDGKKVTIFPEGTTNRNDTLLYFQRGAFLSGDEIQCIYLKWNTKYQTCSDCWQSQANNLIKLLFGLYTKIEINYVGCAAKSEELSNRIQQAVQLYEKAINVKAIKCTAYDKRYIKGQANNYQLVSEYMKQLIDSGIVKPQQFLN